MASIETLDLGRFRGTQDLSSSALAAENTQIEKQIVDVLSSFSKARSMNGSIIDKERSMAKLANEMVDGIRSMELALRARHHGTALAHDLAMRIAVSERYADRVMKRIQKTTMERVGAIRKTNDVYQNKERLLQIIRGQIAGTAMSPLHNAIKDPTLGKSLRVLFTAYVALNNDYARYSAIRDRATAELEVYYRNLDAWHQLHRAHILPVLGYKDIGRPVIMSSREQLNTMERSFDELEESLLNNDKTVQNMIKFQRFSQSPLLRYRSKKKVIGISADAVNEMNKIATNSRDRRTKNVFGVSRGELMDIFRANGPEFKDGDKQLEAVKSMLGGNPVLVPRSLRDIQRNQDIVNMAYANDVVKRNNKAFQEMESGATLSDNDITKFLNVDQCDAFYFLTSQIEANPIFTYPKLIALLTSVRLDDEGGKPDYDEIFIQLEEFIRKVIQIVGVANTTNIEVNGRLLKTARNAENKLVSAHTTEMAHIIVRDCQRVLTEIIDPDRSLDIVELNEPIHYVSREFLTSVDVYSQFIQQDQAMFEDPAYEAFAREPENARCVKIFLETALIYFMVYNMWAIEFDSIETSAKIKNERNTIMMHRIFFGLMYQKNSSLEYDPSVLCIKPKDDVTGEHILTTISDKERVIKTGFITEFFSNITTANDNVLSAVQRTTYVDIVKNIAALGKNMLSFQEQLLDVMEKESSFASPNKPVNTIIPEINGKIPDTFLHLPSTPTFTNFSMNYDLPLINRLTYSSRAGNKLINILEAVYKSFI